MTTYKFGDVIIIDFPMSGSFVKKRRPALVVLDIGDSDLVLAPITTKKRDGPGDYCIRDWRICGLLKESCVRLAKVSCLEKPDISHHLGTLTEYDKKMIADIWKNLFIFSIDEI